MSFADKTVYRGRAEGRSLREERVYDLLDSLNIEYKRIDHGAAATMADCEEVDALLETEMCKNLFLCNNQRTKFYLLLLPGEKKFSKEVSKQIDSPRLFFAQEEYMLKYLDILPGAVSILGLMNDKTNAVELLIDKKVLQSEFLGCHPCVNTTSLKISVSDIIDKFLPAVNHGFKEVDV